MGYKALNTCIYEKNLFTKISWTKYVYACCLWFTCLTTGIFDKQIGAALPDIQQRTHVDFAEASLYVSVFSVGCIIGCLMAGLMYGRVPATSFLCCACIGLAVSEAVFPWCDTAVKAYVVNFVSGVCYTSILSVVVAELCALWGNDVAKPMLISSLFYSIGGLTSSAFIAPFLSTNFEAATNRTTAHTNTRSSQVGKLYIPFTVSSVLTIIAAVLHLILLYKSSRNIICIRYLDFDVRSQGKKLSYIRKILIISVIGTVIIIFGSINGMHYFLPYFLSKEVHVSMSNAAYTISLYATFQGIGRFIGFIIVKRTGNYRMLIGYSIIYLLSIIGLWNCVSYNASVSVIFMTGAGTGLGISVLFPSFGSLVEETFMPVTGSVSGFLFASSMVGEVIMSASIGYLCDKFTPLMLIYATFGEILLFLFSIIMMRFL